MLGTPFNVVVAHRVSGGPIAPVCGITHLLHRRRAHPPLRPPPRPPGAPRAKFLGPPFLASLPPPLWPLHLLLLCCTTSGGLILLHSPSPLGAQGCKAPAQFSLARSRGFTATLIAQQQIQPSKKRGLSGVTLFARPSASKATPSRYSSTPT